MTDALPTLSPALKTRLGTLAKVGALTFCGAFLGVLTTTTVPTTLDGWKMAIIPALGAAVAAELVFLRGQVASALAGQVVTSTIGEVVSAPAPAQHITINVPAASGVTAPPSPNTTGAATLPPAVLLTAAPSAKATA